MVSPSLDRSAPGGGNGCECSRSGDIILAETVQTVTMERLGQKRPP